MSLHVVLSPRTRGIIGQAEFALMKPTRLSDQYRPRPDGRRGGADRGAAQKRIAGAGLDVFDVEPLPVDHPLRKLDNVVLSPHLGYVTQENFRGSYAGVVEDIRAFLDGKPIRLLEPEHRHPTGHTASRQDGPMAKHRCAILDDYQNVALKMADWSKVTDDLDIKVFNEHLGDPKKVARALQGFAIICAMRERTPFPRELIEALPDLRLLITTGMVNRGDRLDAAKARNIMVCGTPSFGNPTTGIAWGLILELTRRIGYENARLKSGAPWQSTVGSDVEGMTLGIIGLGKLGNRVAEVGRAFRMKVVAWSQNITPERAAAAGFEYAASKEELLRQSDIVSIHIPLTPKSRGLIGAKELGLMKPSALLVNTSRGPIVEEAALLDGAARQARSPAPGSTSTTSSRCRSIIRCASSTMSCSRRIWATASQQNYAPISPAWSTTSAASSTASRCGC